MNVETTLWFFAAFLSLGIVNLVVAAIVLPRRVRALPPDSGGRLLTRRLLDVLALSLMAIALSGVILAVVLLVVPSAPAIGRAALFIIVALIFEVVGRIFALLPDTPRWVPRLVRVIEGVLLVLGVLGLLLTALRPASS